MRAIIILLLCVFGIIILFGCTDRPSTFVISAADVNSFVSYATCLTAEEAALFDANYFDGNFVYIKDNKFCFISPGDFNSGGGADTNCEVNGSCPNIVYGINLDANRFITIPQADANYPSFQNVWTWIDGNSGGSIVWGPIGGDLNNQIDLRNKLNTLNDNTAINGFRIASLGSLSLYNMVDGYADEYEDETGIDDINSSGYTYDGGNTAFTNTVSGASDTNLVAQYKLNDHLDNNIVLDSYGGYDGALLNGLNNYTSEVSGAGKIGFNFGFDGTDDYVVVPYNSSFDFSLTEPFAVSFWISKSDTGNGMVITHTNGNPQYKGWTVAIVSQKARLAINTTATARIGVDSSVDVVDGSWHHVVVTYDGSGAAGGVKFFVDNVLDASSSIWDNDAVAPVTTTDEIYIGTRKGLDLKMNGGIDELRVYDKNLLAVDVNILWNNGNGTDNTMGGVATMILQPPIQTAQSEPANSRLVILEQDIDSITLNADFNAYVSKNGGIDWQKIVLSEIGNYNASVRVIAGEGSLLGSGVNMLYKIISGNELRAKIHGVSQSWDG